MISVGLFVGLLACVLCSWFGFVDVALQWWVFVALVGGVWFWHLYSSRFVGGVLA